MDKTKWPQGPWTDEPDCKVFITAVGLPASIVRNGVGALCGYVGVDRSHPWFGEGYDDIDYSDVHGGLTYAGMGRASCGEDESLWYFGFDCAHSGDLCPSMLQYHDGFEGDVYRNISYVTEQIEELAKQIQEAKEQ